MRTVRENQRQVAKHQCDESKRSDLVIIVAKATRTDPRIRNPLVVGVSSQQRGCQARRRCNTREMTSGISVGGA
jgi:hypothetical protein